LQVSTVIIARDEADRIAKTIKAALEVSQEVLVVDTGSSDDTVQVARRVGARVESCEWQGYGPTKNYAYTLAHYDWILSLDADEVPSSSLISAIKELSPQTDHIYTVNRLINFLGQDIYHCKWHPDWVPRLFHRKMAKWDHAAVHEKLLFPEHMKLHKLDGLLHHYSFRSRQHFVEKTADYSKLAAEEWMEEGSGPGIFKSLIGPWWKYVQTYYQFGGYKDGTAGKEIATILAEGVRVKLNHYKKLKKG